jgi:hypothetical protein
MAGKIGKGRGVSSIYRRRRRRRLGTATATPRAAASMKEESLTGRKGKGSRGGAARQLSQDPAQGTSIPPERRPPELETSLLDGSAAASVPTMPLTSQHHYGLLHLRPYCSRAPPLPPQSREEAALDPLNGRLSRRRPP